MKKGLALLLCITAAFTFLASYNTQESIVICSSLEQFRGDEMQEQLNAAFPGKNIIVTYMPTGKAASKIYSEGEKTEVDIVVGMETGYLNRIKNSLANIEGRSKIPYFEEFSSEQNDNLWVTWEKQAGAIVVNRNLLKKLGLEAPKTYADLLKPEYKGLIAMPDPKSSGTGYFFFKSWVNTMGEERALAYVDQLHENLKAFTESGSGPIKMLKQGEIAIGLALTFQAVDEINEGQPFDIIFPETGSPYSLTGTALLKGRENNVEILKVYDFIINEFMPYDKTHFSPEYLYYGQVNEIPNYPQNIPYADMTGIQDGTEKERLLSLWKY